MSDLFHFPTRKVVFTAVVFWFVLFCANPFLYAETFSVPQTTQVTLAWDANDPVPDGYTVYQRTEGQVYDYSQTVVSSSETTATVFNLDYDTTYYFVVRAFVGADESGDSNEVSFRSESAPAATYTITALPGANGTLSPSGSVSVPESEDQSFSMTPDAHYYVSDVLVDGVSVSAVSSYTFNAVTADHTISAVFSPELYTIYATAGANGSISPAAGSFVAYGADSIYTITADAGYVIADVVVDGVSMGPVSAYTFVAVSSNHTINALFSPIPENYTIMSSAGIGGAISPAGTFSAEEGSNQAYVIAADSGYAISDVTVDGLSVGPVWSYIFSDLDADHTIRAVFEKTTHTITASAGVGGTISPSGPVAVTTGSDQRFTLSASDGYQVNDLLVDGTSQGTLDSYTFTNVNGDHTIEARFSIANQAPEADAGPDQTVSGQKLVTLIGANSMDSDDGIAAFDWRQLTGPAVDLADPTADQTTFMAPAVDANGVSLEFELTVTDYSGASVKDSCIVNVTTVNHTPVADAGMDQVVEVLDAVVLDGSFSSDSDNDMLSFQWRQTGAGPAVNLVNADTATPAFTAPDVNAGGVSLTFALTVTDARGLKATDTCMVTIRTINVEPVADVRGDQAVRSGDEIVLDGSASTDSDGTIVKYRWKQTHGSPVQLADASAVVTTFIAPQPATENEVLVFELTVADDHALQSMDTCQAAVSPAADTTAPEIQLVDPASTNIKVKTNVISISGTAWDDDQVAQVRWADDMGRSGLAQGTTTWEIDNYELLSRKTTLTITAADAAGNESAVTMRIFAR